MPYTHIRLLQIRYVFQILTSFHIWYLIKNWSLSIEKNMSGTGENKKFQHLRLANELIDLLQDWNPPIISSGHTKISYI